MNFRTVEHYTNRIERLLARGELLNANLVCKAKRNLRKKEDNTNA